MTLLGNDRLGSRVPYGEVLSQDWMAVDPTRGRLMVVVPRSGLNRILKPSQLRSVFGDGQRVPVGVTAALDAERVEQICTAALSATAR